MSRRKAFLSGIALILGLAVFAAIWGKQVMGDSRKSSPLAREQENAKTILAIFRAIEERDPTLTQMFQPDFEIHWPPSLPYGGTFSGLEPRPGGWAAVWGPLQPTEAERKMDPRVVATHDDDVVVLWHQRGRTRAGQIFDGEVLGMYHFREGKLARAQMFYFDTAAVAAFLKGAET